MLETDLIYLTFRKVYILEISSREMRTPGLSMGGWCIYLSTRRYHVNGLKQNILGLTKSGIVSAFQTPTNIAFFIASTLLESFTHI
jgi:hypothetical protein